MVNKKHYAPFEIKFVTISADIVTTSTGTVADVDPFVDDIYFTADE